MKSVTIMRSYLFTSLLQNIFCILVESSLFSSPVYFGFQRNHIEYLKSTKLLFFIQFSNNCHDKTPF